VYLLLRLSIASLDGKLFPGNYQPGERQEHLCCSRIHTLPLPRPAQVRPEVVTSQSRPSRETNSTLPSLTNLLATISNFLRTVPCIRLNRVTGVVRNQTTGHSSVGKCPVMVINSAGPRLEYSEAARYSRPRITKVLTPCRDRQNHVARLRDS
jgi:hypothetical protein